MTAERRVSPRRATGMSLLEVLAAVALLGIVFTALSRSTALGVLTEGESRQLLEASLLADSELARIELALRAGELPEPGEFALEEDGFVVSVEEFAWSPPDWLVEERALRAPEDAAVSEVFGNGTDASPGMLREIQVRVSWSDGIRDRSVERVTFALDRTSALEAGAGTEGGGAGNLSEAMQMLQQRLREAEQ